MTDITNMTDAELDALLNPEPLDAHVYWYHKHSAREAQKAANRLAVDTCTYNVKRRHQPAEVVALYALATEHMNAAGALC
jgi:hypothetical protein